jgi:hypothetical protein
MFEEWLDSLDVAVALIGVEEALSVVVKEEVFHPIGEDKYVGAEREIDVGPVPTIDEKFDVTLEVAESEKGELEDVELEELRVEDRKVEEDASIVLEKGCGPGIVTTYLLVDEVSSGLIAVEQVSTIVMSLTRLRYSVAVTGYTRNVIKSSL